MEKIKIAGLRQVLNLSQINILSLPSFSDSMVKVLDPLAESGINLEFFVAQASADETMDLTLGVKRNHTPAALGLLQGMKEKFREVHSRDHVGMISLFPHGTRAAVIGNFFSAFNDAGIRLLSIHFSLSAISGLIEENLIPEALSVLGEYFELPG